MHFLSLVIQEKYQEMLVEKHGPEVLECGTFFDTELWAKAAECSNKSRLYGHGSTGLVLNRGRISVTSSAESCPSIEPQALIEERIRAAVRDEMQEELNTQLAALLDEKMKAHEEKMKIRDEKLDALMQALKVRVDQEP